MKMGNIMETREEREPAFFLMLAVLSPQILWERSTQRSERWLMSVTNTIQGSHLRDIRNPIRGFDLHKPTLDRVTRGHLFARLATNKDGRRRRSLRYSPLCERPRPIRNVVDALSLTPAFRLIILLVVIKLFVSRLRDRWKRAARTTNRSLLGNERANQDVT